MIHLLKTTYLKAVVTELLKGSRHMFDSMKEMNNIVDMKV